MSKRKHGEARTEEPAGGAPKRVKTAHGESSGMQSKVNRQDVTAISNDDVVSSEKAAANQARKLAKRERRKAAKEELAKSNDLVPSKGAAGKQGKNRTDLRVKKDKKDKKSGHSSGWQVSDAVGGCLVDVDPVFSEDEQ